MHQFQVEVKQLLWIYQTELTEYCVSCVLINWVTIKILSPVWLFIGKAIINIWGKSGKISASLIWSYIFVHWIIDGKKRNKNIDLQCGADSKWVKIDRITKLSFCFKPFFFSPSPISSHSSNWLTCLTPTQATTAFYPRSSTAALILPCACRRAGTNNIPKYWEAGIGLKTHNSPHLHLNAVLIKNCSPEARFYDVFRSAERWYYAECESHHSAKQYCFEQ